MKTFEQIREEQQQLEEAAAIRAYIIEGEKFAKALAKSLGVTIAELTKSLTKTIVKNPINSLAAASFLAVYALFPKLTMGLASTAWYGFMRLIVGPIYGYFNPTYTPIVSPAGRIIYGPADSWGPVDAIIDGIGIGILSIGGLMIALYGKKLGTKIIKAWNKSMEKSGYKTKKPNKRSAKALAKLLIKK
jgi:hypothetical protein